MIQSENLIYNSNYKIFDFSQGYHKILSRKIFHIPINYLYDFKCMTSNFEKKAPNKSILIEKNQIQGSITEMK